MRILVVIDRYPPFHTGGDETACLSVVEGMKRRGHDVTVLTSRSGVGRPVVGGGVRRTLTCVQDSPSLIEHAWCELRDHRELRRVVRTFRPDAIAAWSLFALFPSLHRALRRSGVPVVYNMGNLWLDRHLSEDAARLAVWERPGSSAMKQIVKPMVRRAARRIDRDCLTAVTADDIDLRHVIQCSRESHRAHQAAGFDGPEWTTIYNGVDLARFAGRDASNPAEPLSVLFAGRLVEEKGAHTAIEAVAALALRGRRVSLTVAGPAGHPRTYVDRLRALVNTTGTADRVRLVGMVPYADVPALFRQHHVLVFPSLVREGFPMTLIEAMASGLAIVATGTGGSKEILADGVNALTFDPGDAAQLAACIERLAESVELRRTLGRTAQQWVTEHCSLEAVAVKWESYVHDIIQRRLTHGDDDRARARISPTLDAPGRIA